MIVTGSQRGNYAEIATHLMREDENDEVELVDIRGAVARELHGATAEWDFQRAALTKCRKGFYCVSVNPDEKQPDLSRDQIYEYFERLEQRLGLEDQPRALVRHVKNGREHWHAVYSRTDAENRRAVHMPFDHLKIKTLTIEFARDHDLELPDGFFQSSDYKSFEVADRAAQLETGMSHAEHVEAVTQAWQISDSPTAFVHALEESGYLLATGNRPYVLVDVYGTPRALPRMIDDSKVRTKDIEKFLGARYPTDDLPSVEQAQAMVADLADTRRTLAAEQAQSELDHLAAKQKTHPRRTALEFRMKAQGDRHQIERDDLAARQQTKRENQQAAFEAREEFIRVERERRKPRGLAHFLGQITGINYARAKLHERDDRKRQQEFEEKVLRLERAQTVQREELKQRQILEKRPLERELRSVVRIENEEFRKLKRRLKGDLRREQRGNEDRLPSIVRGDRSPGKKGELSILANTASGIRSKTREAGQLSDEFMRAAYTKGSREDEGGEKDLKRPRRPTRARRPRPEKRRGRERDDGNDRGR